MPGGGKVDDDRNAAGVPFMTEEVYKANILIVHELKNALTIHLLVGPINKSISYLIINANNNHHHHKKVW